MKTVLTISTSIIMLALFIVNAQANPIITACEQKETQLLASCKGSDSDVCNALIKGDLMLSCVF